MKIRIRRPYLEIVIAEMKGNVIHHYENDIWFLMKNDFEL